MIKNSYLLIISISILVSCTKPNEKHCCNTKIIPAPLKTETTEGTFLLSPSTTLVYQGINSETKDIINEFRVLIDIKTAINSHLPNSNYVVFELATDNSNIDNEGYEIEILTNNIKIKSRTNTGLFYAIQSLKQLYLLNKNTNSNSAQIACCKILDQPEFKHRGLHLDVSRHFYSVDFIKKQLDMLAFYKMNTFHWHLTDDQGWRIEIKQLPKLTSIGSIREKTLIGHGANPPFKFDNKPHKGFYSQKDIKEIIDYASKRQITIIPEIELPAHSLAALASYPELGCTNSNYKVASQWGNYDDVICAGKESSYEIIETIISEVAQLFPGKYIHIGGDEASTKRWRECEHCQNRISKQQLDNESELKNYFIQRVQSIVEKHGKQMAGWDELSADSSLCDALIFNCQDEIRLMNILNNNKIVKSPINALYFDHYQTNPHDHPLAIGGYTPLKEVYNYNPIPDNLSDSIKVQNIIGIQANCWTEYMPTEKDVEFMLYPRLLALAEVAWNNKHKRNWPNFAQKLDVHLDYLNSKGVNYYYEVPVPIAIDEQLNFIQTTELKFASISDKYETLYTTDGSEPNLQSKTYKKPITIHSSGTIKAITLNKSSGERSKTAIYNTNKLNFCKPTSKKPSKQGLQYNFYKGRFKTIKEIENVSSCANGIVDNGFHPENISETTESYGIIYTGHIKIDTKGVYNFKLASDDGSALYVGSELVVNNDGIHAKKIEEGSMALKKGFYPIRIYYFQTFGKHHLSLTMTSPDKKETQLLPKHFFN